MTADTLFELANVTALAGWLILAAAIIFHRPFWRDMIAGLAIPLVLSVLYTGLIVFFFGQSEGGFDSLANVQKLFTHPFVALAGWVHYLAFDLFIGAWIAREVMQRAIPRWTLIALLPLTFMFGPAGLLAFGFTRLAFRPVATASQP